MRFLLSNFTPEIMKVINKLVDVPKDKSHESASLYVGNLIILTFNNVISFHNLSYSKELQT
jgi:hypothetical protein